ncbi:MAG TPA: hypothetical protein VFC45_04400 [Pseudolabrys sp.]|nr:hypothetical protein [Pseudolabrys sp.]
MPSQSAHPFAAAVTASSLAAGALFGLLFSAMDAQAQVPSGACENAAELAVMPSPIAPWKGAPLRVIFAAEKPLEGELSLIAPDGRIAAKSHERHGGPPYFWFAEVASPAAGTWHVTLARDNAPASCGTITRDIAVRDTAPPPPSAAPGSVWPLRKTWDRATENLYSAWIEKLFDASLDAPPSWNALHEVLRDRSRNMLFNHLGLGEDETGLVMHPDCADMPYFLRAYFAFKMGLPFGYSKCTRGGGGAAPKCPQWFNIQHLDAERALKGKGLAATFAQYIPIVGDAVHSGSGRTLASDDNSDYYSVKLTQETLRPGTIYADPFGHVLMLTKRVAQTGDAAGVFLAADAQPDGTVAIKRFWRGNFLYVQDPALGTAGFKRFRPIVREPNGERRLTNTEIAKNPQYGDFSLDPSKLAVEDFYDRMDDVMSPSTLDPVRAMKEAISALDEQVETRVHSVENGRKYQTTAHGDVPMPDGAVIFETTGAWEDFSTPSRDLRLLIAIDVVRGFPDRVARRPERYAMPKDRSVADVKAELQNLLASELAARKFSYPRSDGSPWTLTLKDVLERTGALEMAYNPNDCVELRWGASEKSDEASTCKRHAPAAQRAKMTKYRAWFHERRRPPRATG